MRKAKVVVGQSDCSGFDELEEFIDEEAQRDPGFLAAMADAQARRAIVLDLVSCRGTRGFTQTHVAQAMGTSQSTVSEFENGEGDVFLSSLQRYARAVGVQVVISVKAPASKKVRMPAVRACRAVADRPAQRWEGRWYEPVRRPAFAGTA